MQGMKSHGWDAGHDFHVETIRKPLTRNIAEKFVEVKEEIKAGFEDMVQTYSKPGDDGTSLFFCSPHSLPLNVFWDRMGSSSCCTRHGRPYWESQQSILLQ